MNRPNPFARTSSKPCAAPPTLCLKPLAAAVRGALTGTMLAGAAGMAPAAELPVPKAVFATMGRADHLVKGNTLTVKQQTDRAILNWQKFNVGKDGTVRFDQPSAASIALNRIAQSDPSAIFGTISANGQIYLVNQNGFVFGKDAKVNTNTLVATTLNISDDAFNRGITKVVDQDGSAALTGSGEVYLRDASGNYVLDAKGQRQKIQIRLEKGAQIKTDKGGRVILAAPSVVNAGDISSPEGQILMVAATDKVYLQEARSDSKLRGLVVEVGTGGDVTNIGKVIAEKGNATLMGFAVNQNGRVSATTAVQTNGSVRLLAREGATTRREGDSWQLLPTTTTRASAGDDGLGQKARVTLGQNSLTEAAPDLKDKSTAVDGQAQDPSRIEVMGHDIQVQGGATLRSPSGQVSLTATESPGQPGLPNVKNSSRIFIDKGARIDVAGVRNVSLPMERNVVTVELRSNELRDSPLQKKGILYAKKVKVDIRKGTPVADISGALDRIGRTVAERSTKGGTLEMVSEGDAVINQGSVVDVSGGSVKYRDGYINTTKLLSQGKLIDIGDADPNRLYDGIFGDVAKTFPRWNVTRRWPLAGLTRLGRFEKGYVEGHDAGALDIKANNLLLDGQLLAKATNGLHQTEPAQQAKGGALNIDLARAPDSTQGVVFQDKKVVANLGPNDHFPVNPDKPQESLPLSLDGSTLRRSGVMNATIATGGKVEIRSGTTVDMADGGSLSLTGGEVSVNGQINAHNGDVTLKTVLTGATLGKLSGAVELGAAAGIDTSGRWVNDRPAGRVDTQVGPVWIDGGNVKISAQGDVTTAAGSRIDVSGGARRQDDGTVKAGNAGSIALEAANVNGSNLSLGGDLRGYAVDGGKGGTLSLTSNAITIGDGPVSPDAPLRPLALAPDFFRRGGFSRYNLVSNKNGITVQPGTDLSLTVESRVLNGDFVDRPSGTPVADFSRIDLLPEVVRPAGELDLTLAQSVGQGDPGAALRVESGAAIRTDTGGKIKLSSDSSIFMNGGLQAPAGEVSLTVTPPVGTDLGFLDNQGIWIGAGSRIDARGAARVEVGRTGLRSGDVLAGGTVTLHADRGFIVADAGSTIDVSGTSAALDVAATNQAGGLANQRQTIASNGGTIDLRAAEGIQVNGELLGKAGDGPGAGGGELRVALNPLTRAEPDVFARGQREFPKAPSVLQVTSGSQESTSVIAQGEPIPADRFGKATIKAAWMEEGGFSSLRLTTTDRIEFQGDNSLHAARAIELNAPDIVWKRTADTDQGRVDLTAAYVALGSSQVRSNAGKATSGDGVLQVQAGLIDLVGGARLDGFTKAKLTSSGDVRLVGVRANVQQRDFTGEFTTAADLSISADQVYPTTLSNYRIAVTRQGGSLDIEPGDGPAKPVLAAGGRLALEADNIVQNGTLKAPFGELSLKAADSLKLGPGSVTSNSGSGQLIPFGRTQGGLDWIYPLGTQNLVFSAPPAKKLSLNADHIDIASGATVDTRGGGDLFAFEFVPGPGGSVDILDPADPKYVDGSFTYQPKFAVVPSLRDGFSPLDPLEFPGSGLKVGDSVYLSGGGGLPAGTYALLPAHYALLPGAFLVTPQTSQTAAIAGKVDSRSDGVTVVAGYRTVAGTDIRDPLWSGFAVEPSRMINRQAEYSRNQADQFFSQKAKDLGKVAPPLPMDGGDMLLVANSALSLDGQIQSKPADKGRGGRLDIDAQRIAIINRGDTQVAGAVSLVADDLNKLDVSSILIGGERTAGDGFTQLDTHAATLNVGANVALRGQEYLLAAKDRITVAPGARIDASGAGGAGGKDQETLHIDGDNALLRVSSQSQVNLLRSNASGATGTIDIQPGSTLAAGGSMTVDATRDTSLQGNVTMNGGSLELGASRISIGDAPAGTGGLVLSPAQMAGLKVDELALNSRSDLSLFGDMSLSLGQLTVRAAGIYGFDNGGGTERITADSVRLENPAAAATLAQPNGTGNLEIAAKQLELGQGDYALKGFGSILLDASKAVVGTGTGHLTSAGDLTISTLSMTGDAGADTSIDATGHAVDIRALSGTPAAPQALGARLTITADRIDDGGNIALPAGVVSLTARNGDLNLSSGANIDVSGRALKFSDKTLVAPGGRIELAADGGNVALAPGASLDLHGDSAGSLSVTAGQSFLWNGSVDGHGVNGAGSLSLDAGTVGNGGDLGDLANKLAASGFADTIGIRARSGNLSLGQGAILSAHSLALTSDQGSIQVGGTLDASGGQGEMRLTASDSLNLASTARLQAHAGNGAGGKIVLDGAGGDQNGHGAIVIDSGAKIDVSANSGSGTGGSVELRAMRQGDDVAVSGDLHAAVTGTPAMTLEAVQTYAHSGSITATDIQGWKTDTAAFMIHAEAIEGRLGLSAGELRPGVQVVSSGDLSLTDTAWDLLDWRYGANGDVPGVLTLKAAGNLAINQNLSDGFKAYDTKGIDLSAVQGAGASMPVKDMLQPGLSWSLNLAAGGDVAIGSNSAVRTGTGNIGIQAGRDFVLKDGTASVYSAGRPTDPSLKESSRYGTFKDGFIASTFYGEYPVDGGDVKISAGRDVVGAKSGQFFDQWLVRAGNWSRSNSHSGEIPTGWAVALGQADRNLDGTPLKSSVFQQNVGSFGGGAVTVTAGRDVTDLSVMIPTTGKQVGDPTNPNDPTNTDFNTNRVQVAGGGSLQVQAGGDVRGGMFYSGAGAAEVKAGGSVGSSAGGTVGPVIGLGNTDFRVEARQDIVLGAALNPTVAYTRDNRSLFFTYTDNSRLALTSLAGKVDMQNDLNGVVDGVNALRSSSNRLQFPASTFNALSVYPGSLDVSALQGDIAIDRSFVMYPAAKGQLNLIAHNSIVTGKTGGNVSVTQSDADPTLLPNVAFPTRSYEDANQRLQPFGDSNLIHAQTPVHQGDSEPVRIYADQGSLMPQDPLLFVLPKFADVKAGQDMQDVSFKIQHADTSNAISQFEVGRDIRFTSPRNAQGNLVNLTREIEVAGPGEVQVFAGRNIDLGASEGIYTLGNTSNRALAPHGADISIFAGLSQPPQFDAFSQRYLDNSSDYRAVLTTHMRQVTGNDALDATAALSAFKALPEEQRRSFLLQVFFSEIRASATAAAKIGPPGYKRGYDAIATLFPKDQAYGGDLKLFFSKIHTLAGGDINLLVPGGGINAGLAVAFSGQKPASDLGIVAQRDGQVNAFLKGDFQVNQSRVFAMDGGDITIWSSAGNIDAGRGAKAAIAAPPPLVTFDAQGNLQVQFPPVVSGSGIRTAASTPEVKPGDVFLAAPKGVVNAGEAGIGGKNVTIAATAVIGASNINVSGVASGVPTATVATPAVPTGAANAAAGAAQAAQQNASAGNGDKDADKGLSKSARLTPLNVEVIGFGDCSVGDVRDGKPGCG